MTQEALKLALDALTYIYTETTADEDELIDQAITAIKEALAQTQEPVVKLKTSNMLLRCHRCGCSDKLNIQIEYTYPPQRTWVGLTIEDVKVIEDNAPSKQMAIFMADATLKEKNT